MGKVIINKTDATKTARNGSSNSPQRGANDRKQMRAHVDVSRKAERTDRVGVKVNTKSKQSAAKPAVDQAKKEKTANNRALPARIEPSVKKAAAIKVNSGTEPKNHTTEKSAVKRSPRISRFAEPEGQRGAVLEKTIPAKNAKSASSKAAKPEMGLVLRERDIDPEIALMESRARSMERPKPEVLRNSANYSRRSMSGMVNDQYRSSRPPVANHAAHIDSATKTTTEPGEESRLSKAKSMLVGVGVALVVAVIGFAGIGIFGNKKPMCLVHFESNGGSEVEATEVVCGRTVEQPSDPVKEGFTFEGWILEGDPFDFTETSIYKDATLVARWKANEGTEVVTVKFDTDGGSTINAVEIAKGKKLTRPSAPTKLGYVFEDWYLGDKVFDFDDPVNENITLKAKWERRNTSGDNNTANTDDRAKSVTVTGDSNISLEKGKSANITIKVLPSTAKYSLTATSSNGDVVSCNVNKNIVSCTAKASGTAKIMVRDVNSGNSTQLTITVPDQTPPAVTDPDPETPSKPDNPDPEQPDNPDNPNPENPDKPDNPDPENPDNPDPEQPENPDPEKPENPDPSENPDTPPEGSA